MTMEVVKTAGYAPAPGVLTIIGKMRQRTVSGPVDRDLAKRIGIKDSLTKRTLNSLRALGLIEENGKLTATFEALIAARPDEYQAHLAEFLKGVYSEVFAIVDPATATQEQLENAFWGYEPRGQIDNMVRLFLALCEEAGIIAARPKVERTTPAPRKVTPPADKRAAGASGTGTGKGVKVPEPPPPADPERPTRNNTVILRSGGTVTLTYAFDLFELSADDRAFVLDLIDKIKGYSAKRELGAGPPVSTEASTS